MDELFDLIDEDYGMVSKEKQARQIKTRASSFEKISNAWRKFRISRAEKKLEKEKKKALTESYKTGSDFVLSAKSEAKLEKKAAVIARLEAKIKILSRENVPDNYVRDRAIKLKVNMMSNMTANSNNAYSIGLDKADKVFGEDANMNNENDIPDMPLGSMSNESRENAQAVENSKNDFFASTSYTEQAPINFGEDERKNVEKEEQQEEIKVVPTDREVSEMKDSVEGGFTNAGSEEDSELTREEIQDAIDTVVNSLDNGRSTAAIEREEVASTTDETMNNAGQAPNVITAEEVESVVGQVFNDIPSQSQEYNAGTEATLTADDIDNVVGEAFDSATNVSEQEFDIVQGAPITAQDIETEIDDAMDKIRVSRNGTAAKLDKFDENGEVKINPEEQDSYYDNADGYVKYDYKPMTDEEIASARKNIDYDKYEDIYRNISYSGNGQTDENNIGTSLNVPAVNFADVFKPAQVVNQAVEAPYVESNPEETNNNIERELPMVVPERQVPAPYYENVFDVATNNEEQDLHFDYSDTTTKDINSAIEKVTSLSDFEELKRRAIELQKQQEFTRRQVEAAEREVEETEREVEEARRIAEESENAKKAKMEKLRIYTEALEEDCNFNVNRAKLAEDSIQTNRKFVDEQISKVNENEALMNEIDSIIAPEADVVIRRR